MIPMLHSKRVLAAGRRRAPRADDLKWLDGNITQVRVSDHSSPYILPKMILF
jgi:hypothetical protein